MLKIKDNVDFNKIKKMGFKEVLMNNKLYYVYNPNNLPYVTGNAITIYADRTIYDMDIWIDKDRIIKVQYETGSLDGDMVLDKLYDLFNAGYVEKIKER